MHIETWKCVFGKKKSTFTVIACAFYSQADGSVEGHLRHDQGEDGPPHPQRHPAVH